MANIQTSALMGSCQKPVFSIIPDTRNTRWFWKLIGYGSSIEKYFGFGSGIGYPLVPDSGSEQIIGNFSHKIWISFLTFCRVAKYCNTNMESNLLKKSNDIRRQVIWSRLNWFKTWLGEQRCWTSVEHIHVSWFYGLWGGAGWGCGGGGNMEADGTDTTRRSKSS